MLRLNADGTLDMAYCYDATFDSLEVSMYERVSEDDLVRFSIAGPTLVSEPGVPFHLQQVAEGWDPTGPLSIPNGDEVRLVIVARNAGEWEYYTQIDVAALEEGVWRTTPSGFGQASCPVEIYD